MEKWHSRILTFRGHFNQSGKCPSIKLVNFLINLGTAMVKRPVHLNGTFVLCVKKLYYFHSCGRNFRHMC